MTIFGQKVTGYTFPQLSDLHPDDYLRLGTSSPGSLIELLTQEQLEKQAMVLHLKKPIIVHGCERTQSGGIYLPG